MDFSREQMDFSHATVTPPHHNTRDDITRTNDNTSVYCHTPSPQPIDTISPDGISNSLFPVSIELSDDVGVPDRRGIQTGQIVDSHGARGTISDVGWDGDEDEHELTEDTIVSENGDNGSSNSVFSQDESTVDGMMVEMKSDGVQIAAPEIGSDSVNADSGIDCTTLAQPIPSDYTPPAIHVESPVNLSLSSVEEIEPIC